MELKGEGKIVEERGIEMRHPNRTAVRRTEKSSYALRRVFHSFRGFIYICGISLRCLWLNWALGPGCGQYGG